MRCLWIPPFRFMFRSLLVLFEYPTGGGSTKATSESTSRSGLARSNASHLRIAPAAMVMSTGLPLHFCMSAPEKGVMWAQMAGFPFGFLYNTRSPERERERERERVPSNRTQPCDTYAKCPTSLQYVRFTRHDTPMFVSAFSTRK